MISSNYLYFILTGAAWTVALSCVAFVAGGLSGFAVALCRISPVRAVRWGSGLYVQVVQGMPPLVLMFLSYFGLALSGVSIPAFLAAALAMTINVSAYAGEMWRGSIESVPRNQWESAESLALSRFQRMRLVILPQAMRIATPPTTGFMVQVIKNTSLASVVGLVELVRAGQLVNNWSFAPLPVYGLIAAIYFGLCYPLSYWSRKLEARLTLRKATS